MGESGCAAEGRWLCRWRLASRISRPGVPFGLRRAATQEPEKLQNAEYAAEEVYASTRCNEQACISRSARGAVWGVLTCLFAQGGIKGPKIFFACGAPRIPLEISKETVFSLQCFSFGPGAVLGGAYMLVRQHACSSGGVITHRPSSFEKQIIYLFQGFANESCLQRFLFSPGFVSTLGSAFGLAPALAGLRPRFFTPMFFINMRAEAEAEAEAALIDSSAREGQGCVAAGAALLQAYCHSITQP